MAYSIARLTLYALISSIEEDLRDMIVSQLSACGPAKEILGPEVWEKSVARYKKDSDSDPSHCGLDALIGFTDFPELVEILNRNRNALPKALGIHLKDRAKDLAALAPIRNRVAHTRPLDFEDFPTASETVQRLVSSKGIPWDNLRNTSSKLSADPSFVFSLEIPDYDAEDIRAKHNLPMPDFDETGFIGRKQYTEDIKKACLIGPYPVITIIGEGGVGKTALALEIAYDILQDERCQFEAIVWTSSKTSQLTGQEIVRIENAICDSIGMFRNVATRLGANSTAEEPFQEILDYLREFKILLILDNLETVLDGRIMSFLGKMPMGSKVLITSRIGLGAYEYRVPLEPLEDSEAVQLLRAVARARHLSDLTSIPNNTLAQYCGRMKKNPGYIKWFVAAVQAGRRPEEVLAKPDIFLDYCMSNVYQYLQEVSRKVLRTMLCVPGPLSQVELAFLSGLDVPDIQRGIAQLLTTSMLETTRSARNNSYETRYELTSLARAYLAKKHSPSSEELKEYVRKRKSITQASEQLKAEHRTNPYSAYSVSLRSPGDALIGKYLLEALTESTKKNFDAARDIVNKARDLAPGYFEISRVEAWIEAEAGNYSAAQNAYETAVELEPASAPLRLWYGGFLLRCLSDLEGALAQLVTAERLDPGNFHIKLETARVYLYLKRWNDADQKFTELQAADGLTERDYRKIYDLRLQYYQRLAEAYCVQRQNIKSVDTLEDLRNYYLVCPKKFLDRQMSTKVIYAGQTLHILRTRVFHDSQNDELLERVNNLIMWSESVISKHGGGPDSKKDLSTQREAAATGVISAPECNRVLARKVYYGHIHRMMPTYGFLREDGGEEFFFHRTNVPVNTNWAELQSGERVSFTLSRDNQNRINAIDVQLIRKVGTNNQ